MLLLWRQLYEHADSSKALSFQVKQNFESPTSDVWLRFCVKWHFANVEWFEVLDYCIPNPTYTATSAQPIQKSATRLDKWTAYFTRYCVIKGINNCEISKFPCCDRQKVRSQTRVLLSSPDEGEARSSELIVTTVLHELLQATNSTSTSWVPWVPSTPSAVALTTTLV